MIAFDWPSVVPHVSRSQSYIMVKNRHETDNQKNAPKYEGLLHTGITGTKQLEFEQLFLVPDTEATTNGRFPQNICATAGCTSLSAPRARGLDPDRPEPPV